MLFLGFSLSLFVLSSFVPLALRWGGATVFVLSQLTADLWAALARLLFFGRQRSPLTINTAFLNMYSTVEYNCVSLSIP